MKIVFFETTKTGQEIFTKYLTNVNISFFEKKLDKENVHKIKDAETIFVFTGSVINKKIIDLLPNLKFINTGSTGFDHIDINYCKEKGIKVSNVEVKHVDLPPEMQRAMAKQAEAERERRAKIIHAEGEFQASKKLRQAADVISGNPTALQLRYLQTLTEVASEKNSTTIFPVPIDLLKPFIEMIEKKKED